MAAGTATDQRRRGVGPRLCAVMVGWTLLACAACSSSESTTPVGAGGGAADCIRPDRLLADGRCVAPGIQDDGCPAGELGLDDGSCRPAGIPPQLCADGFEPADHGCEPIVPEEPCPPGQMAVPGESECREVAPCGDGPWGDIPIDGTTQHVDGSYAAGSSDGTAEHPWSTIGEGVFAAAPGAIVAIAEGSYAEDVAIVARSVRLWGVCPARTEIVGSALAFAALDIHGQAHGTEVRGVAVRGDSRGVVVEHAEGVRLDRLWVHDTAGWSLLVNGIPGHTAVEISNTLVEQATEFGIVVDGADAALEAVVVRGTQPLAADPSFGAGIIVQGGLDTAVRSRVQLRGSLVEANHANGVFAIGSDLSVEATVVRGTLPSPANQLLGRGIDVEDDAELGARCSLELRGSMVDQNHDIGVLVMGSDATIEATVMRGTQPNAADDQLGNGLAIVLAVDTSERANATVRSSLIEHNHDSGLVLLSSDATIEGALVRDTQPCAADGWFGRGMNIGPLVETEEQPTVMLRGSRVAHNRELGLLVIGSQATIEGLHVHDTQPQAADDTFGRGLNIEDDPGSAGRSLVTLRSSLIERSHEVGLIVFGSDVTVEGLVVRDTQPAVATGLFGAGIQIEDGPGQGQLLGTSLANSLVERNHDAGVLLLDAGVSLEGVVVRGTAASPVDGLFGDGVAAVGIQLSPAVELTDCLIEANSRAGAAVYGARINVRDTSFECNFIHLNAEDSDGNPGVMNDLGGNTCGCDGQGGPCQAVSTGLDAPAPLPASP